MRNIAVIPARGGSKRVKDKNIIDFYGQPLLSYPLDIAKKSKLFEIIHVSTDSLAIKAIAESCGAHAEFLREKSLADDISGVIPVLRWVVNEFVKLEYRFDNVCMLMPSAPLILEEDLIAAYELFINNNRQFPVVAVANYPVPIEWSYDMNYETGLLSRVFPNEMTNLRSQVLGLKYYDAGAFGFFKTEQLLDESYDLSSKLIGYKLPRHRSVDIDTYDDLEFAKMLYKLRK